jgi:hypothetical protein
MRMAASWFGSLEDPPHTRLRRVDTRPIASSPLIVSTAADREIASRRSNEQRKERLDGNNPIQGVVDFWSSWRISARGRAQQGPNVTLPPYAFGEVSLDFPRRLIVTRELASRTRPPRASFDQHDLRVALSAQQIEGHIPPVPMESEIEARLAETQLVQGHIIQKGGHDRVAE